MASVLAALLAALFAGWAAYETRRSAEETNRAARASVWNELLSEYASPEMLAAMKLLRVFQQQHPSTFAEDFNRLLVLKDKTEAQRAEEVSLDSARRRVGNFFEKVKVFYDSNILELDFIAQTWTSDLSEYITEVLCPLEHAKTLALYDMGAQTQASKDKALKKTREFEAFFRTLLDR